MWVLLSTSLAIVSVGALLMADISPGSDWTALLAGFIVSGIGIGLANPTIAAAALRVVDPARTGMASGISNTAPDHRPRDGRRGVRRGPPAARRSSPRCGGLSTARSSRPQSARPACARRRATPRSPSVAEAAFVSGLRLVFLIGFLTVLAGSIAAAVLVRRPAEAPEPVLEPAR